MYRIIFVALLALNLIGCILTKSYVDPKYKNEGVGYSSIKKVNSPHAAKIDIEFQRNGERYPGADVELRSNVERIFRAAGVVTPISEGAKIHIKVICNNIGDVAGAAMKGFGTGLTLGAAGTEVTDLYSITIEFKRGDTVISKRFDHAIHTTVGNKAPTVKGVEPTSLANAFSGVMEDVILQFIKEMQSNNELSLNVISVITYV